MLLYVAVDGDDIGQKVGRARLADDVEAVRRLSTSIDAGQEAWKSYALMSGGSVVESGGDECLIEIPADKISELPAIKHKYETTVGATCSIGVGMKVSEASKALLAAKLKGKDQILFYNDEVEQLIAKAKEQQQKTEEEKIGDEYLGKAEGGPRQINGGGGGECPICGGGRQHGFTWHQDGREHPVECNKCHTKGTLEDFDVHPPKEAPKEQGLARRRRLNKAAPAMNTGAGAGFGGVTPASKPTVDAPTPTQGEHSEGEALQALIDDPDRPQAPEMTHAAADFEKQLHDEATRGEGEDADQAAQSINNVEGVKQQIARALQVIKVQQPVLEQVKQASPQLYQAIAGLTQSVIALAREISPMSKSEKKQSPAELMAGAVRDSSDPVSDHDCKKGDCYVQSEALHHLLGGAQSGWEPHHLFEGSKGPHWFLKHSATGKVLDTLAGDSPTPRPYHRGKRQGFITPEPSKQARGIIAVVLSGKPLAKSETMYCTACKDPLDKDGHCKVKAHWEKLDGEPLKKMEERPASGWVVHHRGLPCDYKKDRFATPCRNKASLTHFDTAKRYCQTHAKMKGYKGEAHDPRAPKEPLDKGALPMPKAPAHHVVTLPVGSVEGNKTKVQHQDGSSSWVQVGAGQIQSQDPARHPISSRNPSGR